MKKEEIADAIRQYFPLLNQIELAGAIADRAVSLSIPSGKILLNTGENISLIPLVVKVPSKWYAPTTRATKYYSTIYNRVKVAR
ncbi:MAG: hypothetical protein IPJ82_19110 [Lewinellaceae bacterium]|nr:hypothetical protein [Lewinellaceae bacterium]